jgi:hypothetical protein
MSEISNRIDFTNYCLRRLGAPVIDINVDDDQVQDRIDDALQYYQDYHFDALQKIYYVHYLTDQDCANRYINMDPAVTVDSNNNQIEIVGVSRIFPISDSQATINMFDLRYQLRLNELYDFTSASYINYTLTQQHLRSLELMFTGEVPIRFQRHMHRLFIDWAWGQSEAPVGTVVVAECYALVDPQTYSSVWNDRWLKRYATALIKRTWGSNMKKYNGVQLLGGVTMDGQTIFNEAEEEIKMLEHEMITDYSGPLEWFLN